MFAKVIKLLFTYKRTHFWINYLKWITAYKKVGIEIYFYFAYFW